jgi:hypothetical protein
VKKRRKEEAKAKTQKEETGVKQVKSFKLLYLNQCKTRDRRVENKI